MGNSNGRRAAKKHKRGQSSGKKYNKSGGKTGEKNSVTQVREADMMDVEDPSNNRENEDLKLNIPQDRDTGEKSQHSSECVIKRSNIDIEFDQNI